jgi:hypothetical protein
MESPEIFSNRNPVAVADPLSSVSPLLGFPVGSKSVIEKCNSSSSVLPEATTRPAFTQALLDSESLDEDDVDEAEDGAVEKIIERELVRWIRNDATTFRRVLEYKVGVPPSPHDNIDWCFNSFEILSNFPAGGVVILACPD